MKIDTESNGRADELSKRGAMLNLREMAQLRASSPTKKTEGLRGSAQSAFTFWVEEWLDCEELKLKLKDKGTFAVEGSGSQQPPRGVVCGRKQISLHLVRKEQ